MKDFFHRHPMAIGFLAIASLLVAIAFGLLLIGVRELQLQTLQRIDRTVDAADLPGPKGEISERSKVELEVVLRETPHVVGGWITKLSYGKTENPIIHYWAKEQIVKEAMDNFNTIQLSGRGYSSAELNRDSAQSVRNSEEAKTGIIKCGSLQTTNLTKIAPDIVNFASGVCRATIPPFDENVNLAVVVVVDLEATENTPEIQAIRRSLLRLQIDIFNRDYQGRETWARQLGER